MWKTLSSPTELSSGSLLLPVLNVMYTVPPSPHASHGQLAICFLCCQPRVRLLLCCLEWVELQRKRKHFVNHVCKHCDESVLLWATIFFYSEAFWFISFCFLLSVYPTPENDFFFLIPRDVRVSMLKVLVLINEVLKLLPLMLPKRYMVRF